MNYYERHLGDYARDTAHLTMIEHGAYTLLLDRYYATETGIPADQAHRVARARSKEEKLAVDVVLGEFFTLDGGVWVKGRVCEEITKHRKKLANLKDLQERDEYRKFRDFILERDNHACKYCGITNVPLQLDHVFPKSKGGADTPENLVLACKPCNTSKGAKTIEEWSAKK